jgi:hypothetical protein
MQAAKETPGRATETQESRNCARILTFRMLVFSGGLLLAKKIGGF